MNAIKLGLVIVLCLHLCGPILAADPPDQINYQGVLRNSADKPLDEPHFMVFRFFSAASGGDEVLIDEQGSVPVSGGLFNVRLGGTGVTDGDGPGVYESLRRAFADYPELHLQVEINGEALLPRVPLASAGFALNSHYVRGRELVTDGPLALFVDATLGNDANDGLSASTAKRTIQSARRDSADPDR